MNRTPTCRYRPLVWARSIGVLAISGLVAMTACANKSPHNASTNGDQAQAELSAVVSQSPSTTRAGRSLPEDRVRSAESAPTAAAQGAVSGTPMAFATSAAKTPAAPTPPAEKGKVSAKPDFKPDSGTYAAARGRAAGVSKPAAKRVRRARRRPPSSPPRRASAALRAPSRTPAPHGLAGVAGGGAQPNFGAPNQLPQIESGLVAPNQLPQTESGNTEAYRDYGINPMTATAEDPLSTFAIDVDTAAYVLARRKLAAHTLPPPASVRVEEFVNYFRYDYPGPSGDAPFAVHMDAAPSPLTPGRHLLRVGVQARKLSVRERKPADLVFLVDVSGSMSSPDKLGLAQRALRILVDNLKDSDTVSLVTYAGNTRVVLEPTGLAHKARIVGAIEDLRAGGSTSMGSGIQLAYDLAARNLGPERISRVIVLSDGDANVGATSHQQILATIRGKVKEGVTLSTIGFGMGNYKDVMMEQLANQGNGNYYYIDTISQARRVFQEQLGGTLEVVAKDVKIQVEFAPEAVVRYRLIGYENRDIADHDFRNDRVDAGEIGAGHTVTALYELELTGAGHELATVRIRAKKPRGTRATENTYTMSRDQVHDSFGQASADFRFATAVMASAEVLRQNPRVTSWKLGTIERIAKDAIAATAAPNRARVVAERREFLGMLAHLAGLRSQLAAR